MIRNRNLMKFIPLFVAFLLVVMTYRIKVTSETAYRLFGLSGDSIIVCLKMAIVFSPFLVLATAVCGLLTVLLYKLMRPFYSIKTGKLIGPKPFPILGNALEFSGNINFLDKLMELIDSYPSPFRFWAGNVLICFVHEADHIQTVLASSKTINKADVYKMTHAWLGDGLLTAPEKRWRVHRKLILPSFNTKILESFVEIFAKQSQVMTTLMRKELHGNEFDIRRYISLSTIDSLCETIMGVNLNVQTDEKNRFVYCTKRILDIICYRLFKVWLHPNIIFNNTKLAKELNECLAYVHNTTHSIICRKKYEYNNSDKTSNDYSVDRPLRRKAFMDLIMELSNDGEKLTEEEIREEVNTMMVTGYDSTSTMMGFILTILAICPDVQEKVYQELCDIYGDEVNCDTLVKHEDLNRMKYLERVIKETLRMFPLTPIIARQVSEDLQIGDDYTLPKGSTVVMAIYKIHRWEKYWPEPLKFDPDRFLPENVAKRHPHCYMPFSGGPRNCIGMKYAYMSMKTTIATVLRRYILSKDKSMQVKDIKVKIGIVLRPVDELKIKISERKAVNLQ